MARKTNRALITNEQEVNLINEDNKTLIEDYLNYLETIGKRPSTLKVYRSNLNIFFVWLMKNGKNKDFVEIKKEI